MCAVPECNKENYGRKTFCKNHYRKFVKYGDPTAGKTYTKFIQHGTRTAYVHHNCRCESCLEANAKWSAELRDKRKELVCPEEAHGTANGYWNWSCRCDDCKLAGKNHNRIKGRSRKYKMTDGDFEALLISQNYQCAICDEPFDIENSKDIHVDHDHSCCPTPSGSGSSNYKTCGNCVRGLLCPRCNVMLGLARDDIRILASAIEYLEVNRRESEDAL